MQSTDIDPVIRDSLRSFYRDISSPNWCSREREMVSLFAFGHLSRHCTPGNSLSLAQIGIEVAVKQLPRSPSYPRRGETVCKDLVVWPAPGMTLWDCDGKVQYEPLVVMEWKVNHRFNRRAHLENQRLPSSDVQWLQEKSISVPDLVGYAVLVESTRTPRELVCARIQNGDVDQGWLVLNGMSDEKEENER